MRAVVQRVVDCSVTVDGVLCGHIDDGLLVYLGVGKDDVDRDMMYVAEKTVHLRVFPDQDGKMNRSLLDIGGELLIISQFTLYANCKKGRRPGFDNSMPPDEAEKYYNLLLEEMAKSGLKAHLVREPPSALSSPSHSPRRLKMIKISALFSNNVFW